MNNFFNRTRGFFTAPTFEGDEGKTRSAKLLHQMVVMVWSLPIVAALVSFLNPSVTRYVLPVAIVLIATLVAIMFLNRAGRTQVASSILVAMVFIVLTYLNYSVAGEPRPLLLLTVIVIMMSGLLLRGRSPMIVALLLVAQHLIILTLSAKGLIVPQSTLPGPVQNALVITVSYLLIGYMFRLAIGRIQTALTQVREDEAQLESRNRELEQLSKSLEQRVADRTHNLALAAEVGRSVSQVRALDGLLKDACELILKEFNLYYVQVYLTDAGASNLRLEAGTGSVGAQLVGRGHSLPLNTGSINGRAATEKNSVVIPDTAQSATFRQNPLLPETRGEMAVPLIAADKVVGVLDMQSNQPGVLTEEVLPAFEALAGQLAVAIQNATLLAETEEARAEVEKQARRLVRQGWSEHLDAIHKPEQLGFVFDHNNVAPLSTADESQLSENGKAVSAPIAVTGESLGSLVVEMGDEALAEQTSGLVNIVARQVAQQIENLRLLESAERYRSEAEEASRRLTREGWKSYAEKAGGSLQYFYDSNEVRPLNGDKLETAATIPLKVRDEAVGKVAVQGLDKNDTDALNLANAVAERLGAHIEGLRQYDQTQSALAQSEKLFQASRRLTQADNLQDLVLSAVEALGIRDIDRVVLGGLEYAGDGDLTGMTIVANWTSQDELPATPIGTHYSKEVLSSVSLFTSTQPLFFNDMWNDERVDETTKGIAKRVNYRSLAALPLFVGSRQDAMVLFEGAQPHVFTSEEIRLFTALAPQLATVLENRRQFERAQRQAKREATLNVINQKIQSATSVEAVLQIAARELGTALGAPMTVAQLSLKDKAS